MDVSTLTTPTRRWMIWEVVALIAILSLAMLIRAYHLDADPPRDLSVSTDVYTDTGQYTLNARLYVERGDFNPFDDNRWVTFLFSTITLLAVPVFKLFGAGFWQSNLVGLLYSFGAVLLFFLFVRRVAGSVAGLIYLAMITFDYNQIFYGRLPFQEHPTAFFSFLAIVLLIYRDSMIRALLAGVALGASIFFSKVLGAVFLVPFAGFFAYRLFVNDPKHEKMSFKVPLMFVGGLVIVSLAWYFFSYRPFAGEVSGYLTEHTMSLYGAPQGLDSPEDFLHKLITFGVVEKLFERIFVPALLNVVFLGMVLYHVCHGKYWRFGFSRFGAGHLFLAIMIVAYYVFLAVWNYRPLRYELILIYPMCGAAAVMISMFAGKWHDVESRPIPWLFGILSLPLLFIALFQTGTRINKYFGDSFYYEDERWLVAGLTLVAGATVMAFLWLRGSVRRHPPRLVTVVISLAIVAFAGYPGLGHYLEWSERSTFTGRDISRDLGKVLSPTAVVAGPYAPQLTLESELGAIIHMFTLSNVDRGLFKTYPITHLLLDVPHVERAREDYPRVMGKAQRLFTYHFGQEKVELYKVAGNTGNPTSGFYGSSLFEQAAESFLGDSTGLQMELLEVFCDEHSENIAANIALARWYESSGRLAEAETWYKKAVEFSSTSYVLCAELADLYGNRYRKDHLPSFKDSAIHYYERALYFAPEDQEVYRNMRKILGS